MGDIDQKQIDIDKASRELVELGIQPNEKNIEAVLAQKQISQHPAGYEEVTDNLHDDERLRGAMQKHEIKEIIHSEGPTLWDHVKLSIKQINASDIADEPKQDLRIVMLYHDLGKVDADTRQINIDRTQDNLDRKRSLHKAMIGHERYMTEDIKAGLVANGIQGERLHTYMLLIANHMNTALLDQSPQKTAEQVNGFGDTERERKEVIRLLVQVFHADGKATEHVTLVDGILNRSINEKKANISYDQIANKYQVGKKKQMQDRVNRERIKEQREYEESVLGSDIQTYVRSRHIPDGKVFTETVRLIKNFLKSYKHIPVDRLKSHLDSMDLTTSRATIIFPQEAIDTPFKPKSKIFGEEAFRINGADYERTLDYVMMKVNASGRFIEVSPTVQFDDKPDHGDIDLIAYTYGKLDEETYISIFGDDFVKCEIGENQDSVLVKVPPSGQHQVDFIHASDHENFETKLLYYSRGHISRLIGVIADKYGYKYGVEGFAKRYTASDGTIKDFIVSRDLRVGLAILGFDADDIDHVNTISGVIAYISSSNLFDPSLYKPENLRKTRRRVYRERQQERYLVDQLSQVQTRSFTGLDPDKIFADLFPDKYQQYLQVVEAERVPKPKQRQEINGFVVANVFDLQPGTLIGRILGHIKEKYPDAKEISEEMEIEIRHTFQITK